MATVLLSELGDVDWSATLRFLTREEIPKSVERKALAAFEKDAEQEERRDERRQQDRRRVTRQTKKQLREAHGKVADLPFTPGLDSEPPANRWFFGAEDGCGGSTGCAPLVVPDPVPPAAVTVASG